MTHITDGLSAEAANEINGAMVAVVLLKQELSFSAEALAEEQEYFNKLTSDLADAEKKLKKAIERNSLTEAQRQFQKLNDQRHKLHEDIRSNDKVIQDAERNAERLAKELHNVNLGLDKLRPQVIIDNKQQINKES